MKSIFKRIKTTPTLDSEGHIYHDKKRDCYIFINENEVMDIQEEQEILIIKKYEKSLDKKKQKQKIIKIKTSIGIALLLALTSVVKYKTNEYFKESNKEKIEYLQSNRGVEDNLLLLHRSMDKNQTISPVLKNELKQYMDLFAQYDSGMPIVRVANRIKYIDFSKEESISPCLLKEIFDCKHGEFIAQQLYWEQQNYFFRSDSYEGLLINYLSFHTEDLEKVLCGQDLRFEIDGKKYLVCLDKLNSYYPEVYNYLLEFHNEKIKEIHLPEDYRLGTNVFSPLVEAYSIKEKRSYYYKKEKNRLVDYTDKFYIDELSKIINEHGVYFDYYDEKSRQLLYFYIDAYKRSKEVSSFSDYQDISSYIYRMIKEVDVKSVVRYHYLSYEELLDFIRKDSFSYKPVVNMWDLAIYPEAVSLLQELNLCLKIEVIEGNITKNDYDIFIELVSSLLENNPEEYEKFQEANVLNDSMDGFRLGLVFEPKNNVN